MSDDNQHGGARKGAGRPRGPESIQVKVFLPRDLYDAVTAISNDWKVLRPEAIRRMVRWFLDTQRKDTSP